MAEKRKLTRHRKRLMLRFGIDAPARIAFTEDISTEGLFVKTVNTCGPGAHILIDLTMPSNLVVQLEAEVRWAKKVPPQMVNLAIKSGMGLKITKFLKGADIYSEFLAEIPTC